MSEIVIRPTLKWVRFAYTVWFLIAFVSVLICNNYWQGRHLEWVAVAVVVLWAAWPLRLQIRRRLTKLVIEGDKLRLEVGLLSKTTRTLHLSKIQDITVKQTMTQRLLKLGDLALETAGESGPLVMRNLDYPQAVADQIMDLAREQQPPQPKRKEQKS
ncbi:MAG: PH domain-containing protein [Bryobacteraceae bacterium]